MPSSPPKRCAGLTDAPDFTAAAGAIDGNSADLKSIVQVAYGKAAAVAFRDLWDAHITAYVAYIDATQANDSAASAQATSRSTSTPRSSPISSPMPTPIWT